MVEDPGKSTRLKKGDRIIMNTGAKRRGCPGVRTDGGYAEYVLVEEDDCLPMPENISDHIGSLLEPLAIGYGIAEMADIQPGDKVLITGCGIIASMVARWAKQELLLMETIDFPQAPPDPVSGDGVAQLFPSGNAQPIFLQPVLSGVEHHRRRYGLFPPTVEPAEIPI